MSLIEWVKSLAWAEVKQIIRLQFSDVQPISTVELAQWLDQQPPVLLDARSIAEYAISHLANAQIVPQNLQTLKADIPPDQPIVVYCSIGYRSAKVVRQLQALGYQQVFNLEGSIFQWANEGRELYQGDRSTQKVHPYSDRWGWFLEEPIERVTESGKDRF